MNKVEFHINDYVITPDKEIGRICGVLQVWDEKTESIVNRYHVKIIEGTLEFVKMRKRHFLGTQLKGISINRRILLAIGFKRVNEDMFRYEDMESRKYIVIDYTDFSVTAFKCGRHIMVDFVHVDFIHDIQHLFEHLQINFPFIQMYLSALRKSKSAESETTQTYL